ncbi:MAG: amidohydrolase family protein [Hyphomicrobiales bacterium]
MNITHILTSDTILTMDAETSVILDGAIAIDGETIAAIGPRDDVLKTYPGARVKNMGDALLMPGLINAHAHSGLLRGTAEHLPVWEWLTTHINPMHKVLNAEEARAASRLCYAESLLGGTTTVVDMWRFMAGSCEVARNMGNRLVAVPYVGAHPDYDYFESLDDNEALLDSWQGGADGRVRVWVGLEHPFYTDEAGWKRAVDMANRHQTGINTHCSEAQIEVDEFHKRYGKAPVVALADFGFFDTPLALIAHAVWLSDEEIAFIADKPAAVSHNPISNMKLASGIASVEAMRAAGIPVGLGTDGEKENNNFDMFEELKAASLMAKLRDHDAAALDSWQVLKMGTCEGARAIGLSDQIGSLEVGKKADIIAVATDTPRMTPLFADGPYFNLQHNLVHAVKGSDVRMTMVAGQIVAEDGKLTNDDMADILSEVRALAPGLFARRAAFLEEHRNGTIQWVAG